MRVALLSYSTKPRGGVVHTLALAEALARAGADVTVWTLGRGGDSGFFRPVSPAVAVEIVPFPDLGPSETVGQRILRSIAVLRSALRPEEYDIVHAQDCISANAAVREVGRGRLAGEAPCVRTVHHLDRFTTPELAACHERAIVRPYAHICVSAAVAAEVRSGWGIDPVVIPNGVDYSRFADAVSGCPSAATARSRWRSRFGRYILAVGGIEPRKGSMDLLSAYALMRSALMRSADPGVRLVIAGGETLFDYRDYRARWEARASELFGADSGLVSDSDGTGSGCVSGSGASGSGVSGSGGAGSGGTGSGGSGGRPVVLGPVAHDDLPSLMAAASAFCFPSLKEGFGLAAMEALAAGVPVVARDLPVLREVFRDTVRYASSPPEFAAALRAALASGSVADSGDSGRSAGSRGPDDRAAGQALAASYTWDAAAAAHLKFYSQVLAW